ncbi:MAG: guanylate kinase [Bacteroidota bacterium]
MKPQGKLLIFCAPSGSGKTTVVRHLIKTFPTLLDFSISATTRAPREGELHGKSYYFLSEAVFRQKIADREFAEYEMVYEGLYYGTLQSELDRIWSVQKHVLFDVDVSGAKSLKAAFGERAVTIFVKPPSLHVLEERLRGRKTESEEELAMRLEKAAEEIKAAQDFDVILINDDLTKCLAEAEELIRSVCK